MKATPFLVFSFNNQICPNCQSQVVLYIFVGCEDKYQEIVGKYATYDEIGVSGYQIQTYGKNVWLKTEEAIDIFGENKKCYILALIYHESLNPPVEKQGGAYVLENGSPLPKKEVWFNGDGSMVDWDTAWTDSETGTSKE